jgi:quercetin dioxygenase-like cupin family protein
MGFRADVIKPPTTLKAGDVLFMPAGTIHAAKNVGSDVAKELATCVLEKGKPVVTFVK